MAVKPGEPILFVQATSLPNISTRVKKSKGKAELAICLRAGIRFEEVWGWYQTVISTTGERRRWIAKRVAVNAGDQADIILEAKRRGKRKQEPDLFSGAGNVGR